MTIDIVIDNKEIARILLTHLNEVCNLGIKPEDIVIEVKSSQNWKAEWERAVFRATVKKITV